MSQISSTNVPFLYREREVAELKYYIVNKWPSVILHGMKGTGKTSVTRFVLDTLVADSCHGHNYGGQNVFNYSWISCCEKMTPAQMYRHILLDLISGDPPGAMAIDSGTNVDTDCDWLQFVTQSKCNTPTMFVKKLREHYQNIGNVDTLPPSPKRQRQSMADDGSLDRRPQLVIVLDQADILVKQDSASFINFIQSLHEIICDIACVSVILISRLPPICLSTCQNIHSYVSIFFRSYSFNQTMNILKKLKPDAVTFSDSFYENYLNLSVRMVYNLTRNLKEIKFLVDANYGKYVEPIRKGEATENDSAKLWRSFEQTLRRSLINIGIKGYRPASEMPSWNNQSTKNSISYQPSTLSHPNDANNSKMTPIASASLCDDIPYTMKFLLIAAFLASNNSKTTDKRFFLKGQSKHCGRKSHALNNREEENDAKSGYKYFPMERLIHIYRALLDLNYDFGTKDGAIDMIDDEYDSVIERYEIPSGRQIGASQEEIADAEESGNILKSSVLASERMKETSNDFLSQLETLVRLKLIDKISATSNQLSSIRKFKISDLVSFEYVDTIAKTIDFDLRQHLEMFMFRK